VTSLLRTKRFVWALALAVSTAVMLYAYVAGRRYVDAVRSVEHTLEVSKAIDDVVSTLKDEETGQRGFLLTGDGEFLDAYFSGRRALPAMMAELRRSTAESPRHAARVAELDGLAREKQDFIHRTIALEPASASRSSPSCAAVAAS
jgi:CHASE3 domain sensor protein